MSHVRISRKDAERIDSSGRVIVGKTAADDDDDCVVDLELKPRSRAAAHAPGASSHYDTDSRAFSSATWLEPGGASSRFNLEDVAKKLEGVEHSTLERGLLTLKQTALGGHVNQFTLVFRDKQVELLYLKEHALLHKRTVYLGYLLQLFVGLMLVVLHLVIQDRRIASCKHITAEDLRNECETMFGKEAEMLVSYAVIGMVGYSAVLVVTGCLAHFYIHTFSRVRSKLWAPIITWAIYLVEIVGIVVIDARLHGMDVFWSVRLFVWYNYLFLTVIWLAGLTFLPILVMFFVITCVFYGTTIPIALDNSKLIVGTLDEVSEIEPVFEIILYSALATVNIIFNVLMLISAYTLERANRRSFLQTYMIRYQQNRIIRHKTRNEDTQKKLLNKILPSFIVDELKRDGMLEDFRDIRFLSSNHDGVSLLYADIVGFTAFAKSVEPSIVMGFLNNLFQAFDELCDQHNVYKIETIGDCYVAAVGIVTGKMLMKRGESKAAHTGIDLHPSQQEREREGEREGVSEDSLEAAQDHYSSRRLGTFSNYKATLATARRNTSDMLGFAKAILYEASRINMPNIGVPTRLRVGIHTGPCMSGIVGTKNLRFCLFGDTVDIAAAMEQGSRAGVVHASQAVVDLTPAEGWKPEGEITIEDADADEGEATMKTYALVVVC